MPETPHLCLVDICRFHTNGNGMHKIITSTSTSEIDRPQKLAVWSIHCIFGDCGGSTKDKPIGVHSKRMLKKNATPQIKHKAIVAHKTTLNTAPRKIRL